MVETLKALRLHSRTLIVLSLTGFALAGSHDRSASYRDAVGDVEKVRGLIGLFSPGSTELGGFLRDSVWIEWRQFERMPTGTPEMELVGAVPSISTSRFPELSLDHSLEEVFELLDNLASIPVVTAWTRIVQEMAHERASVCTQQLGRECWIEDIMVMTVPSGEKGLHLWLQTSDAEVRITPLPRVDTVPAHEVFELIFSVEPVEGWPFAGRGPGILVGFEDPSVALTEFPRLRPYWSALRDLTIPQAITHLEEERQRVQGEVGIGGVRFQYRWAGLALPAVMFGVLVQMLVLLKHLESGLPTQASEIRTFPLVFLFTGQTPRLVAAANLILLPFAANVAISLQGGWIHPAFRITSMMLGLLVLLTGWALSRRFDRLASRLAE